MSAPIPTARSRQQLVLEFQPRVRAHALRLLRQRGLPMELDELVSVGNVGLLEAVDRFDVSRGTCFESFADRRIFGAMMDHVRAQVWVPRTVVARARSLGLASETLRRRTGRAPTRDEMASHLGLSPGAYDELRAKAAPRQLVSGDQQIYDDGPETLMSQQPSAEPLADERFISHEQLAWTRAAINRLPSEEREVLRLYYLEEQGIRNIAEKMGTRESRVSQIHRQGLRHLRSLRASEESTPARARNPRLGLDSHLAKQSA